MESSWFEDVFGLCGERGAIDLKMFLSSWLVRDFNLTDERGVEEIWGLGISGVVVDLGFYLG